MTYLVTGAAGFIGSFTARALIREGHTVIGLDSVNDYYRTDLKEERLEAIAREARDARSDGWRFYCGLLEDAPFVERVFAGHRFDRVIHLAAQAGVRYSIDNPRAYASSNLDGFLTILESCRSHKVPHLAFASSSSVYGTNSKTPFSERDPVDHPVSLYAATKRANELMAHAYSNLYSLPVTGMRFFTVYGPMGRPDMAYFKFADSIMRGTPIDVFNNGNLLRDFTYIDDVVKAVLLIADRVPERDPEFDRANPRLDRSDSPFRVYNVGNERPEPLERFISVLEDKLGAKAVKKYLPMQSGDVYATAADTSALWNDFGWKPSTPLDDGLARFAAWYKEKQLWLS